MQKNKGLHKIHSQKKNPHFWRKIFPLLKENINIPAKQTEPHMKTQGSNTDDRSNIHTRRISAIYIYHRTKSKFNNVAQKQTHAEENKTIGERKSARPDLNNAKQ